LSQSKPAVLRRFAKTPAKRKVPFALKLKKVLSAWQLYVLLLPSLAYIVIFKYWLLKVKRGAERSARP